METAVCDLHAFFLPHEFSSVFMGGAYSMSGFSVPVLFKMASPSVLPKGKEFFCRNGRFFSPQENMNGPASFYSSATAFVAARSAEIRQFCHFFKEKK